MGSCEEFALPQTKKQVASATCFFVWGISVLGETRLLIRSGDRVGTILLHSKSK